MKYFYLTIALAIIFTIWIIPEEKVTIHETVTLGFIGVYSLIMFVHTDLKNKKDE